MYSLPVLNGPSLPPEIVTHHVLLQKKIYIYTEEKKVRLPNRQRTLDGLPPELPTRKFYVGKRRLSAQVGRARRAEETQRRNACGVPAELPLLRTTVAGWAFSPLKGEKGGALK